MVLVDCVCVLRFAARGKPPNLVGGVDYSGIVAERYSEGSEFIFSFV